MGYRRRLVDGFFKLIYSDMIDGGQPELLRASIEALLGEENIKTGSGQCVQFFEIAVGNVMTAPIRHRIELDAV